MLCADTCAVEHLYAMSDSDASWLSTVTMLFTTDIVDDEIHSPRRRNRTATAPKAVALLEHTAFCSANDTN
jgi:hypothetical protein